jgi:hypothetical protein
LIENSNSILLDASRILNYFFWLVIRRGNEKSFGMSEESYSEVFDEENIYNGNVL